MHACFTGKVIQTQSSSKMSEIWQRKMATFFHRLDINNDGVLLKSDFKRMTKRFIAMEKVVPAKQEELIKRGVDVS